MEPQSGIRTWQWVVTVIVIIILIVIGVMVFGNKGADVPSTNDGTPSNSPSAAQPGANRIVMSDQFPGNVAYLSTVQVASSSWVAIQTDSAGVPGKVIGYMHFDAGINPGGKITLSEPMIDGRTYYAIIYSDNGSGKFDTTTATPLKDSKGNVVMTVFKASSSVSAGLKG